MKISYFYAAIFVFLLGCNQSKKTKEIRAEFPAELVDFVPYKNNPVFSGTGTTTWDKKIRERGYILKEGNLYKLWYTGYNPDSSDMKFLGYATSMDGIHWKRYPGNPIHNTSWVEDMQVVKHKGKYYMFAEGRNDLAHMLTSTDGIHWKENGKLDIRQSNGEPISPGPFGTPTVWVENGKWYLFYERNDAGIWLATSADYKIWKNVQDDPVIKMGPEAYDRYAVAMNQVVKYKGRYYSYYHGNAYKPWRDWSTNVAVSDDLIHWEKYLKNPIIGNNKNSGILVFDGSKYRFYTMVHPAVDLYFPAGKK